MIFNGLDDIMHHLLYNKTTSYNILNIKRLTRVLCNRNKISGSQTARNTFLSLTKDFCLKGWNSLRSVTAFINLLTFYLIHYI